MSDAIRTAKLLVKVARALTGYRGMVETANTLEDSLRQPGEDDPGTARTRDARVSALRRRWLFARDAVCVWSAGALHRCGMRRLADKAEECCPWETVEHCHVCHSRELRSMTVYERECPDCAGCIRGILHRANAERLPDEPVMTEAFVHELLSLHRVPEHEVARASGWGVVEERDAADEKTLRARLRELASVDDGCRHRWILAVLPVAGRLTLFMRTAQEVYGISKDDFC